MVPPLKYRVSLCAGAVHSGKISRFSVRWLMFSSLYGSSFMSAEATAERATHTETNGRENQQLYLQQLLLLNKTERERPNWRRLQTNRSKYNQSQHQCGFSTMAMAEGVKGPERDRVVAVILMPCLSFQSLW